VNRTRKGFQQRLNFLFRHPVTGKPRPITGVRQVNASLAKLEQKLNRIRPSSYPFYAVIEPTNICNLHCPFCPTGANQPGRKKGMIKMDTLNVFLKQLGPYLLDAELCNWGESLLHPDIYDIIRRVKREGIHAALSAHLSLGADHFDPEEMIRSGLDYLVVSMDAACKETYAKYRKGGDFELVLKNIRALVEARGRLGSASPYISLKFLVFRHNEDERDRFAELVKDLGADQALFFPAYIPEESREEFQPLDPAYEIETFEPGTAPGRNCHWLWTGVVLNWDGSISPCCHGISYTGEHDFGNIHQAPFREIWRNEIFQQARAVFKGVRPEIEAADLCYLCRYRA
jgi:radical SAM protein with 4Fe4S-binding SPASM domain